MGWGNQLFRVCESQFQTQEDTHSDTDLVLVLHLFVLDTQ